MHMHDQKLKPWNTEHADTVQFTHTHIPNGDGSRVRVQNPSLHLFICLCVALSAWPRGVADVLPYCLSFSLATTTAVNPTATLSFHSIFSRPVPIHFGQSW